MLFNSYEYIFLFLPISIVLYFYLNKKQLIFAAKVWLAFASLFFYSYWNIAYLPLILFSIIFNYAIGAALRKQKESSNIIIKNKSVIIIGIAVNLCLLGYFKYADFFLGNIELLTGITVPLLKLVLPLGISFFTFTQITYIVDVYNGKTEEYSFTNYVLFVTYFPHLLAGPIIHHKDIIPQFNRKRAKLISYQNICKGLLLFSIGLAKKVIFADNFGKIANMGFNSTHQLDFFSSWVATLAYTFQIYFDFSGYTDMALGSSLMLNIHLPINFNSPYKALSVQDFWRRWHITLSHFLRDYIYIPLGGSRVTEYNTMRNLMVTFLLGGLWHGAGWTFILWGCLHGIALVVHRIWKKYNMSMNNILAWISTFTFISITWVFFRANSLEKAFDMIHGLLGGHGFLLPLSLSDKLAGLRKFHVSFGQPFYDLRPQGVSMYVIAVLFVVSFIIISQINSMTIVKKYRPAPLFIIVYLVTVSYCLFHLGMPSEFLYFNF